MNKSELPGIEPSPAVEYVQCSSAEEFLDYLAPNNPVWAAPGHLAKWVFRGHWDADWPIVPSAWRTDGVLKFGSMYTKYRLKTEHRWSGTTSPDLKEIMSDSRTLDAIAVTACELEAVREFANLADELGLRVPAASDIPFPEDYIASPFHLNGWDPAFVTDAFGFAQHHGVPTRLTDWTRRPRIGAFFSCRPARGLTPKAIAVWALDSSRLEDIHTSVRLKVLNGLRSEHSFLHAQDGLFVWHVDALNHVAREHRWPAIEDKFEMVSRYHGGALVARKVTLPVSQAIRLREMLRHERITLAHLMPTYNHIAGYLVSTWAPELAADVEDFLR